MPYRMTTASLYDLPGKFGGWPSIARCADGELAVVFSGDRRQHVDPFGKTLLVRSRDQGESWSEPQIINDSPLDDRDPGLVVCPDGSWLVSLFTSALFADWPGAVEQYGRQTVAAWQPHIDRLIPEIRQQFLGNFTLLSVDRGTTWSDLRPAPVTAPHGPILGAGGELLFLGNRHTKTESNISCWVSRDVGASWQQRGVLAPTDLLAGCHLCEPHLVQLPGGRLLAHLRVNSADIEKRQLMQSSSDDGGRTWSPVESTGLWGLPPHLIRHSSGRLLCSYGHRRKPFGVRVAFSTDAGGNWTQPVALKTLRYQAQSVADDVGEIYFQTPDFGYPATVELDDGSLYTVWYQSRPEDPGAVILGCRWVLPD